MFTLTQLLTSSPRLQHPDPHGKREGKRESKREGKRPVQPEPAAGEKRPAPSADGRVAMVLALRGEPEISEHRRELITQKSGCRPQAVRGAP